MADDQKQMKKNVGKMALLKRDVFDFEGRIFYPRWTAVIIRAVDATGWYVATFNAGGLHHLIKRLNPDDVEDFRDI